jgi:hypothetical protein
VGKEGNLPSFYSDMVITTSNCGGAKMLKRFENPVFMELEEINKTYEGMWVLAKKTSKDAISWDGGYVVGVASDTDENWEVLHESLDKELNFVGFLHYGHIDRGENLDVVYIASK